MTESLILEKLDKLEKQYDKFDKKVDKIETAVGLIAVQSERINNLSNQVQSLWIKHDEAFGPVGMVSRIKNFQAGCPRDRINDALTRQWAIIAFLALMNTGTFLKALGVF